MKQINVILFLVLGLNAFSQKGPNTDSLNALLKTDIEDSVRIQILNKLSVIYEFSSRPLDAEENHKKMFDLVKKTNNIKGYGDCFNYVGRQFYYKQKYDSAIKYFEKSAGYFEKINYSKGIASARNNIAAIYSEQGHIKSSIVEHRKLVSFNKKTGNKEMLASSYSNLGYCFMEIAANDSAIFYLTNASKLNEKLKDQASLASNYYNLATINFNIKQYNKSLYYINVINKNKLPLKNNLENLILCLTSNDYFHINKTDSAKLYIEKAIKSCNIKEDRLSLISAVMNRAQIYLRLKDFNNAQKDMEKAIDVAKEIGAKNLLSSAYNQYGVLLMEMNKAKEAIGFFTLSNKTALENNNKSVVLKNIQGLANANTRLGDFKEAATYLDSLVKFKDRLNETEIIQTLNEIETKYETEKKDLQIQNANSQISIQQEKNRQKSTVIWIGFFALLITIFFGIIAFISFKRSQQANKIINLQKQTIEVKQKEVLDSIRYAKRIQQSLMPTEKYIERVLDKFKNKI